jgi:hypothetical protein
MTEHGNSDTADFDHIASHCTSLIEFKCYVFTLNMQNSTETLIKNNKNLEVFELRKFEEPNWDGFYFKPSLLKQISVNCLRMREVRIDSFRAFPCENVIQFIQSCSSLQLFEFRLFDGPDSFGHIYYENDLNGRIVLDVFQIESIDISYILNLISAKPFTTLIFDWLELVDDLFWHSLTSCLCHSLCDFTMTNSSDDYSVKAMQNFLSKCEKLTSLDIGFDDCWKVDDIIETLTAPNSLIDIYLNFCGFDVTSNHALQILNANPQIVNASMISHRYPLLEDTVKSYMENRQKMSSAITV